MAEPSFLDQLVELTAALSPAQRAEAERAVVPLRQASEARGLPWTREALMGMAYGISFSEGIRHLNSDADADAMLTAIMCGLTALIEMDNDRR